MRTLIVLAHPEPASFTGAWARASRDGCTALGQQVMLVDLCADGFDPVEHPRHHGSARPFDVLKTQAAGPLPTDVARQAEALRTADRVILHFPIWWFAPPAILKGWCERVMANGHLHDTAHRFDSGLLRGQEVLFCVSTGGDSAETGPDGREGHWELLLWPLAQTFRYCGATVKRPVAEHGVHGYHSGPARDALEDRLHSRLSGWPRRVAEWPDLPEWRFHADADFDGDGRLRPDAPDLGPFIQAGG